MDAEVIRIWGLVDPGINRQVKRWLELGHASAGPCLDIRVDERELRRGGPPPDFILMALRSVMAQEVMRFEALAERQLRLADTAPHVIRLTRDEVHVGLAFRGCH